MPLVCDANQRYARVSIDIQLLVPGGRQPPCFFIGNDNTGALVMDRGTNSSAGGTRDIRRDVVSSMKHGATRLARPMHWDASFLTEYVTRGLARVMRSDNGHKEKQVVDQDPRAFCVRSSLGVEW